MPRRWDVGALLGRLGPHITMYEDNMNTNHNSTTIPDEIAARIAEAAKAGKAIRAQRDAAAEEASRKSAIAEHAKLMDGWDKPLTLIYQVVPEWAHAYIIEPSEPYVEYGDHDLTYGWVEIALPGCTTIRAWAVDSVIFEASNAKMYFDEEFCGIWYAANMATHYRRTVWSIETGESDFAVAVETAHDNYLLLLELRAEAERRNAEAAQPSPVADPKPVQIEIPHDPAAKVLAAIAELDLDAGTTFERGLLYGLITIAAELRAIRDGIDDIAAVVVANDPKANKESQQ